MTQEYFEQTYRVEPGDIDQLGHVNNVVYLRWVQDVAVAHWCSLTTSEQQTALNWVVVRHEIDYKHAARQGDSVVAKTWVGTASGLHFERFTDLYRAGDNELLAQARTVWCPIDSQTGHPQRVPAAIRSLFSSP
jgi:acyl-CoA thioester hydrolase